MKSVFERLFDLVGLIVYVSCVVLCVVFFFQAEDGIRDLVRSRGLGDVCKRQVSPCETIAAEMLAAGCGRPGNCRENEKRPCRDNCLLYTSDAADERSSVDLGGRRIIKKKTSNSNEIEN